MSVHTPFPTEEAVNTSHKGLCGARVKWPPPSSNWPLWLDRVPFGAETNVGLATDLCGADPHFIAVIAGGRTASPAWWTQVWANSGRWWRDREACHTAARRVAKSQTQLSDWTPTMEGLGVREEPAIKIQDCVCLDSWWNPEVLQCPKCLAPPHPACLYDEV